MYRVMNGCWRSPAQDGFDATHHLAGTERLDEVIIGSQFETLDTILFRLASGKHENGCICPGAYASADLHTIERRQHQVKNYQVGMFARVKF